MRKDEQSQTVSNGIATIKIREVRCACADCGAHVLAWQGYKISGWCDNCGSYEVRPLPVPIAPGIPLTTVPLAG
jgi:Zn finger protein HypA/HybF involved in hydrogenase expression